MFCSRPSVASLVVHYTGAPCIFRGLLHSFARKYLHARGTWFCSDMPVEVPKKQKWKNGHKSSCNMKVRHVEIRICFLFLWWCNFSTSNLFFFFFFPQLKELTIIWAGVDPRLLFSLLFPMGTYVAIGIILCNIRAACTAEGGWEKMASFVIIYSVLYLPICTLSDNALLNKRTQEMEYKENVSMNSNICHIWLSVKRRKQSGRSVLLRTSKVLLGAFKSSVFFAITLLLRFFLQINFPKSRWIKENC